MTEDHFFATQFQFRFSCDHQMSIIISITEFVIVSKCLKSAEFSSKTIQNSLLDRRHLNNARREPCQNDEFRSDGYARYVNDQSKLKTKKNHCERAISRSWATSLSEPILIQHSVLTRLNSNIKKQRADSILFN